MIDAKQVHNVITRRWPGLSYWQIVDAVEWMTSSKNGVLGDTTKEAIERIQLSFLAWLRHEMTNYDVLLRNGMEKDKAMEKVTEAVYRMERKAAEGIAVRKITLGVTKPKWKRRKAGKT